MQRALTATQSACRTLAPLNTRMIKLFIYYRIKLHRPEDFTFKLVVYTSKDWEIDVRYHILDDGSEEMMDIMFINIVDGRQVKETMYELAASDGSIVYMGSLSSQSSGQEFYDFIKNSGLSVQYINEYTFYKNTNVIISTRETTYSDDGTPTVTEENYSIEKKIRILYTLKIGIGLKLR